MFDAGSSLPLSGSSLVLPLVYGVIALFVTGPLVGDRTIAMSGWDAQCQTAIASNLAASLPAETFIPKLDCNSLMGPMFGRQGQALCQRYGEGFGLPFLDQLQAQQRKVEAYKSQRLDDAAAKAGSRCSCAVNLTLEAQRVPLAIYAGSLRLIIPPAVKRLPAELQSSLAAPQCAMKG